ncbi:hypothetical protein [Streptomyces sp. NPDC049590]
MVRVREHVKAGYTAVSTMNGFDQWAADWKDRPRSFVATKDRPGDPRHTR